MLLISKRRQSPAASVPGGMLVPGGTLLGIGANPDAWPETVFHFGS
jgi:hypothetical protein